MNEAVEDALVTARQAYTEGNLMRAEQDYLRAAELSQRMGNMLSRAKALRHFPELSRKLGQAKVAQSAGAEAVEIYRSGAETHHLDLANALRVTALAYQSDGAGVDAVPFWSEARQLYKNAGVDAGVEECDTNLTTLGIRDRSS